MFRGSRRLGLYSLVDPMILPLGTAPSSLGRRAPTSARRGSTWSTQTSWPGAEGGREVADCGEHDVGLGEHRHVAAVDRVGRGAHALGRGSLQIWVNGVVVIGDDVGARLRFPRGACGLLVEQFDGGGRR